MASNQNVDPEAYVPTDDELPVDAAPQFDAEHKRRSNKRGVWAGVVALVVALAVILGVGYGVTKLRAKWRADEIAKKEEKQKQLAAGRQGKNFQFDERRPDTSTPPPLPAAVAEKADAAPLPAPAPEKGRAGKPPAPIPMMLADTRSGAQPRAARSEREREADAEQRAAELLAKHSPPALAAGSAARAADGTVQRMAQESKGKPTKAGQVHAAPLGDRSYVIAKGSWIPCILETQLDTTVPGMTSCLIEQDIYSDNGKVALITAGSRMTGSFGGTMRRGAERIGVMWERVRTTDGVVLDLESPAGDGIGTTGVGGTVNNHWAQRIGAALILSLTSDLLDLAKEEARSGNSSSGGGQLGNGTVNNYYPSNTTDSLGKIAEKVLDSQINIPPTLYKNRGDRVMAFVANDLWFDSSYQLVKSKE